MAEEVEGLAEGIKSRIRIRIRIKKMIMSKRNSKCRIVLLLDNFEPLENCHASAAGRCGCGGREAIMAGTGDMEH